MFPSLPLTSIHPVCDRVGDPVQSLRVEPACLFLISSPCPLDNGLHLLRDHIRKRRKDQGDECYPPVVIEQHAHISEKCHTRVKDLCGELSHALHAVIHIGDRLCDDISGTLFFQFHTGFMY